MVITFPHMGRMYIPVKALFEDIEVPIVVPPPISKRTLEIGTRLAPEMACLPLKINLGNYIESIEKGADTIVIVGSCGPCRFGYYGVVAKEILRDFGYDVEVVILDAPRWNFISFIRRVHAVLGNRPWKRIVKAGSNAYNIMLQCDELLDIAAKKRVREEKKGETDSLIYRFESDVVKARGSEEILYLVGYYKNAILGVKEREEVDPLRVGIIGEIYTLIEPYVNLHIEKQLGQMGVEVVRSLTVSEWVKKHLVFDAKTRSEEKQILNKAKRFLNLCVGGHAWQSVANAAHYSDIGLDGVIHIMPLGCMPEVVAKSILPVVSEEKNIPVMSLIVDEMTGEAGYRTRLEAFVDLLARKRGMRYGKAKMLSGH